MSVMPSPSCVPRRARDLLSGDRLGHELEVAVRDERHVLDPLPQPRRERRHLVRGPPAASSWRRRHRLGTVSLEPNGHVVDVGRVEIDADRADGSSPSPRPRAGPASEKTSWKRDRPVAVEGVDRRGELVDVGVGLAREEAGSARTTSSTSGPSASSTGLEQVSARRRSASARCRAPALTETGASRPAHPAGRERSARRGRPRLGSVMSPTARGRRCSCRGTGSVRQVQPFARLQERAKQVLPAEHPVCQQIEPRLLLSPDERRLIALDLLLDRLGVVRPRSRSRVAWTSA